MSNNEISLLEKFSESYSVKPGVMLDTLKNTAFKQSGDKKITDAQMCALLVVADQYKLNPFTREIYAFPDKFGGIIPVVGIDGWIRIANQQPTFKGAEFEYSDKIIQIDDFHKPCYEWVKCSIHRDDRDTPMVVYEYLEECYKAPYIKDGKPIMGQWQLITKRFLRHRAFIQALRYAFGFSGIYLPEEGNEIFEAENTGPSVYQVKNAKTKSDAIAEVLEKSLEPNPEKEENT